MPYDFDVIVIGSGAGGGTFAHACAQAGKSVLLLERGRKYSAKEHGHDERTMLIEKRPYDDRSVDVNGHARRLYTGGILGGSTSLYGAALMRPSREDFHPGRYYGERIPRSIWDWPIRYDELEPYYTLAEQLYGVTGCDEDDFGPLEKPRQGFPDRTLPLEPINRRLVAANRLRGLRPFRLPLAIDFSRCLRCESCPGHVCPTGARRSSTHLIEQAIADGARLEVQTGVEVEAFCKDGSGRVSGVSVRERDTGRQTVYRARRYALAAGAVGSPLLLLRSEIGGELVGRNYMYHLSPLVAGLFVRRTGAETTFVKQVCFADYYLGAPNYAHKLGIIQSLPVPGPLMLAKTGGKRLPRGLMRMLRRRMLPLVGIIEDLPSPVNQVRLGPDGGANIRHSFARYDLERGKRLAQLMKKILKRAGALFCLAKTFPSDEHVAHQCGTLRFGRSPVAAVADADCRLFEQPDVFVVDGSFFPTSLGVGPALTIIANALRVARLVSKEI